jgi:OOP family OmpA-OmpF porin
MKKITTITILLFIVSTVNAQYKDNPRAFGDKAYNNKDYYEAAFYYKKAAEGLSLIPTQAIPYHATAKNASKKGKPEDRAYISYQLAESYRLYENYVEAEPWYYKVLNENYEAQYPLCRLWYGVCLRANQHFDEAITQLQQFDAAYKGDAKYKAIAQKEIANCRFAKEQYQYPVLIDIAKMKGSWFSDGSDYSMVKRDGNSYFTSSRFVKDEKVHLNRVYSIKGDSSAKPEVLQFTTDANDKEVEYGTPSFSPDGQRMYFTRWFKVGSKTTHAIYYSQLSNNEWQAPVKLNSNINAEGFNTIQPFITMDGKRMYFVSNKPGGQGGDDIWVADLDDSGNAISSINMGSTINTAMDEQAPYYDAMGKKLIYSSKGFIGLGGFDFFESTYDGINWSAPVNMGYPMNSAKDDLYYMPDPKDANKFYISSDRESDCCLNLFEAYDKRHTLSGLVVDCDTHTALPGVKVSFVDSLSKQVIKHMVLGQSARYNFEVTTRRPYNLVLEKSGYFTKVVPVPASGRMSNDTLFNPDICLQAFKVDKPIVIQNVLYDYDKATLRPESKLVLNGVVKILQDNPKIKIELAAHTDSIGSEKYNNKLSQARAQSCVDYIVASGISETRIYAKGYGKRKPIAPNSLPNGKDNPAGRQLNRRTEFTVLKIE